MAALGGGGLDAVGDEPGEPGADPQRVGAVEVDAADGQAGAGGDAVHVQDQPDVPDGVDHAERAQPAGQVQFGVPVQAVRRDAQGGQREGERLEALAAGLQFEPAAQRGAGGDLAERVDDGAGQPDGALSVVLVGGELVAQEQLADRAGVVPGVGDVQDPAALGVVEVFGAPVDAAVAFGERGGEFVAVDQCVHRGHQIRPVLPGQEVGADRLNALDAFVRLGGDTGEIAVGHPGELAAVVLVQQRKITQMQHEVVLEELDVLVEFEAVQSLALQQFVHPAVDLHAVREVRDLVPSVADRFGGGLLEHVPEVHVVGDQRDPLGRHVRLGREEQVLVVDADGKDEPGLQEEFTPIALVGRQRVEDQQVRQFGNGFDRPGPGVQPGIPLGPLLVAGIDLDPDAHAGDQVGAGPLGRLQHVAAGVRLQDVVAVQEHHVVTGGVLDAVVAGRSAAAAVLRQLQRPHPAGVGGGELPGHVEGSVRAAVVDDQNFDSVERLVQYGPDSRR